VRGGDHCHKLDKLGLFILAGLVVGVLGAIVVGTFWTRAVPDKGEVLIGGISTGLILFLRDIVAAVRAGWEEVTRNQVNEQLALSKPAPRLLPSPKPLAGAGAAAEDVAAAAEDRAEEIQTAEAAELQLRNEEREQR
jgi:hypothetical protein